MQITPYLVFNGLCEEAIEFYKKTVGAKVDRLMRFKDCPEPTPEMDHAVDNKVMHSSIRIGENMVMMSDGRCKGGTGFGGFSLTLLLDTEAEADRLFTALSDGGKVTMPLGKTFFSPKFGMLTDRFGVSWMVLVQQ